jgi:hypothetical protein
MKLIILKIREFFLVGKMRYQSDRLDEIESVYQREKAEGKGKHRATLGELRRVRQDIAMRSSPDVLLKDVYRNR